MAPWAQHLLVLLAIAACAGFLLRQGVLAMTGKKSGLGGCGTCGGCATQEKAKEPVKRTVFLPLENLGRRK